jgi:hypothetical protein
VILETAQRMWRSRCRQDAGKRLVLGGLMKSVRVMAPLVLGTLLFSGCCLPHSSTPAVPAGAEWQTPGRLAPIGETAGVEIMIAYGASTCQHTAMWLSREGKPSLFWDPAGAFGKEHEPRASRRRDLVDRHISREEYLRFRSGIHTDQVEFFRFDLPPEQAAHLHGVLLRGAGDPEDPAGYDPNTAGLFCSYAVSEFLRLHAPDRFPLSGSHIFPHDFAADLYTLSPDRVLLCTTSEKGQTDIQTACRQLVQ